MSNDQNNYTAQTAVMYGDGGTSFCQQPRTKKKLTLTPELRRSSLAAPVKTQCCYSDSRLVSLNGLDGLKDSTLSLDENVELISDTIMLERKHFQDYIDGLRGQAVQLEADIYSKSAMIDDLQLYNCEKLNVIGSLAAIYDEAVWRCESMQRLCEEHGPSGGTDDPYRCALLVDRALDTAAAFKSDQREMRGLLDGLTASEGVPDELVGAVEKLSRGLDECVVAVESATGQEMANALLEANDLDQTVKNVIREIGNFRRDATQPDYCTAIELIDRLEASARDGGSVAAGTVELWVSVKNLFQRNQCLAHKVASLNMHKTGLQLQLEEMTENAEQLERQTQLEQEDVQRKLDMLNRTESMIEQHWDELNTSTDMVIKNQQAQEIDQELEDLQLELDNLDLENRHMETDLYDLNEELSDYQLKCDRMEKEIRQLEKAKVNSLDEYAKSWGHHNAKQKIKYTGKLIKDMDSITQEIKLLEFELEKYGEENVEHANESTVFGRTQTKSEKIQRTFGIINVNKPHTVFRENVVRKIRL
ncbi:myosin-11-like isoform X1 [Adelges cooleyi]|uniref:myosin-11-like isoform X1 n=2 Tax=Adelges cooleyi TaxID=133065 RepID=UPI00217F95B8|nr:myosin-11-like isoform X1 [Adelges cooleyi]